jgi:hypothetical protein
MSAASPAIISPIVRSQVTKIGSKLWPRGNFPPSYSPHEKRWMTMDESPPAFSSFGFSHSLVIVWGKASLSIYDSSTPWRGFFFSGHPKHPNFAYFG